MYIIVIGCGRVGSELATMLSREGNDVVVIDKNPKAFKRLGTTFNGMTYVGLGYDEELLKEAGIDRCDALAAVTDLDNSNMMAAEVASKLYNVPRVVLRLYHPERERTLQILGLDYVCGTALVAQAILDKLVKGHGRRLTIRGDLELIEFIAGPKLDARSILDVQIPNEFRICLVTREGSSFIPWRESILREKDLILAVVKDTAYNKIKPYIRQA